MLRCCWSTCCPNCGPALPLGLALLSGCPAPLAKVFGPQVLGLCPPAPAVFAKCEAVTGRSTGLQEAEGGCVGWGLALHWASFRARGLLGLHDAVCGS